MSALFHSIRWRVQVWHGLILLLVIVAFCLTSYRLAWDNQLRRVDRNLGQIERNLIRSMMESTDNADSGTRRGPPSPARIIDYLRSNKSAMPEQMVSVFSGTEPGYAYFSLRDAEGKILLQSPNAPGDLDASPAPQGGEEWRVNNRRREIVRRNPEGLESLFGVDLTPEREELRRFAVSLSGVGLAVWALGLVGGWWLAGRAIKPIKTISHTATRIADGNLAERISSDGTDSELDQLSRVLNTTFERLHAAFERQKQFTADASHELRTPVTILLSETQRILKRERTNQEYHDAVVTCRDTAERMRRLIEALLQLAHQESSAHTMSRESCDLAILARDAASHLAPLAIERQLAIETELHRAPCVGDPAALNTLITNLIANALQHHHRAGGVIRVTSSLEHDHVVLAVRDDGPGIPAADLPHLFERFYRVDKARTGSSGHSGLGLAIAHTIVENHQGSLTAANNADGRGATFTVRLPLAAKTPAVA